jgi:hypothetical protein
MSQVQGLRMVVVRAKGRQTDPPARGDQVPGEPGFGLRDGDCAGRRRRIEGSPNPWCGIITGGFEPGILQGAF